MRFWIQAGNPRSFPHLDKDVSDLSEAIEGIFPMQTEDAMIVWNQSIIPIGYKYDLAVMIDDLLLMLSRILESGTGSYQVNFGSDTFCCDWDLSWTEEDISISAEWQSVVGHLETVASDCGRLRIGTKDFLAEWKEVLKRIIAALEASAGFIVEVQGYELLIAIESAIQRSGRLYREA